MEDADGLTPWNRTRVELDGAEDLNDTDAIVKVLYVLREGLVDLAILFDGHDGLRFPKAEYDELPQKILSGSSRTLKGRYLEGHVHWYSPR